MLSLFSHPPPLQWEPPFLSTHSNRLVAVVSWQRGSLKDINEQGDAQVAIKMTWVCSAVLHACFVSQDAFALGLLCVAITLGILKGLRQWHRRKYGLVILAIASARHNLGAL